MADTGSDHACIEVFRRWLRHSMTGCYFASAIAGTENGIFYSVLLDELRSEDMREVNAYIDEFGRLRQFAIYLFPRIRTPRGIVRLLRTLSRDDRWEVRKIEWDKHPREGAGLVGVGFKTSSNLTSSVMGFAPLGCMPVTRRAPFVALALWAGEKSNPHKSTPGKSAIGFIDGPPISGCAKVLTAEEHDNVWERTQAQVGRMLDDPKEDGARLRRAAFCLTRQLVDEVFAAGS